jgi:hypothetical protein
MAMPTYPLVFRGLGFFGTKPLVSETFISNSFLIHYLPLWWTIGAIYRKSIEERRTMRTGFAIYFAVAFVLIFVAACNGQEESKNEEPAKEETTAAQDTKVQEETVKVEQETTVEKDLPKSGGPTLGVLALPTAALLVGSGILGYTVLRRR